MMATFERSPVRPLAIRMALYVFPPPETADRPRRIFAFFLVALRNCMFVFFVVIVCFFKGLGRFLYRLMEHFREIAYGGFLDLVHTTGYLQHRADVGAIPFHPFDVYRIPVEYVEDRSPRVEIPDSFHFQ